MQYSVCEKSPNSKIYNKLLFVCGDENIKSESYKLSHNFSTNCIRSYDGKNIKFESKKNWKRLLLAHPCHEQPMLQTYKGLPDGKLQKYFY